jgi:hypothetical protein
MSKAQPWEDAKLLLDAPADHDALGAHQRLADAIADLVSTNRGGKSICLRGTWGSGKSTVIRLLSARLKQSTSTRVVVYDTWVHSGDPLRRAFLDAIIDSLLATPNWLTGSDGRSATEVWQDKRRLLSKSLQVSTKKTDPVLSLFGKLVLGLAFLAPLALGPFNDLAKDTITRGFFNVELSRQIWLLATGLFCLLPAIVILAAAVLERRGPRWISDTFSLLLTKGANEQVVTSTTSPEPTSIEFQDSFGELISNALAGNDRRLLVVVDNLDRLPAKEAQAIWALLRSFLDNPRFSTSSWIERVWIVVPLAAMPTGPHVSQTADQSGESSYFEKLFQVRLTLPPPLLTDWRKLLSKLSKDAFPNIDSRTLDQLIRVADLYFRGSGSDVGFPTPRELVLFINDTVALSLQWKGEIALPHLAAFALWSDQNFLANLRDNKIPPQALVRLLSDNDLRRTFAALYFNVEDKGKAHHLLLEPDLLGSLQQGLPDFIRTQTAADPQFIDLLESVLVAWLPAWAAAEQDNFFNAIMAIGGLETPLPSRVEDLLTDQCAQAIPRLAEFSLYTGKPRKAFEQLLHMCTSDRIPAAIADLLFSIPLFSTAGANRTLGNPETGIPELLDLIQHPRLNPLISARGTLRLPIDAKTWQMLCAELDRRQSFAKITYSTDPDEISRQLIDMAVRGEVNSSFVSAVGKQCSLLEIDRANPFVTDVIASAAKLVRAPSGVDERLLYSFALLLVQYSSVASVHDISTELVNQGFLYSHLGQAQLPTTSALLILAILTVRDDAGTGQHVGASEQGIGVLREVLAAAEGRSELIDEIGKLVFKRGWTKLLRRLASVNAPSIPLARELVKRRPILIASLVTEAFPPGATLSAKAIDELLSPLADAAELQSNYRRIAVAEICKLFPSQTLVANLSPDEAWVLDLVLELGLEDSASSALFALISKFSTEDWMTAIKSPGHLRSLAKRAADLRIALEAGNRRLYEAILSDARAQSNLENDDGGDLSVLALLGDQSTKSLSRALYEEAASTSAAIRGQFWIHYGTLVKDALVELGARSNLTRRFILQRLHLKDFESLSWLNTVLEHKRFRELDDDEPSIREAELLILELLSTSASLDQLHVAVLEALGSRMKA